MSRKLAFIIFIVLVIGTIYRLVLTSNGNFIFNMDNARDLVDVREMVELKKLRLTGPTSAIEGFFNGPAWYYLLAIPYALSGGDPYSAIVMEILLWAVGGYFLLKLVSDWGRWIVLVVGSVWVASNYIVLATVYSFNPNPVTLLTPLFIFTLVKYIKTDKLIYAISVFLLGGLFFNFEMNFGIFTPLIIFFSLFVYKKFSVFKSRNFWIGSLFFATALLPQVLFDLKHDFLMTNSVLNYLRNTPAGNYDIFSRLQLIANTFFGTFIPTLMNYKTIAQILIILFVPIIIKSIKLGELKKNPVVLASVLYIFIPFVGYVLLPVTVNPWHLGGPMTASLILIAFVLSRVNQINFAGKITSFLLGFTLLFFSFNNIANYFRERSKPNMDPSLFANEMKAIDYAYKLADGKNFKLYSYLPSVIDFPYQYLIWWHGRKSYGYLPSEYAYSPNIPRYISNKQFFSANQESLKQRDNSGLVFMVKEPDRIKMRRAWEDDFDPLKFISKEMIGPLEIEVRKEETQP
ncbi:hypothetical protein HYW42_02540 [Candidatus Daviesbacteria bacterium]|nr:hypothetical protein [Candidatus Daviesbacteria bacterium]